MTEIPVLGYNSSKYDFNLIKSRFAEWLDLAVGKKNFIVKKFKILKPNKRRNYVYVQNNEIIFFQPSILFSVEKKFGHIYLLGNEKSYVKKKNSGELALRT